MAASGNILSREWLNKPIRGVLLDITGVLYESNKSGGTALLGSIKAIQNLMACPTIQFRLCTNETQLTQTGLSEKLVRLGFDMIKPDMIFSPGPAVIRILEERKLRPYLLIYPDAYSDYSHLDQNNPNCVVIGDAAENFSFENMNKAFQVLIQPNANSIKPSLFALGMGKYYKHGSQCVLDVGAYAKALEYASGIEPEVFGKPSKSFFMSAIADMQLSPEECVMIGDDIVGDVEGAQQCGIRGIQVRTGKFNPEWENHPSIKPNGIVDNLSQAISMILDSILHSD